jgi:hypothetical protein
MSLSGASWVAQFPTSNSVADLEPNFQAKVTAFLNALSAAGAHIQINATLRPPQRAYMMHFAWLIARGLNPALVPAFAPATAGGDLVDIQWVHPAADGSPDLIASKAAAVQMNAAFGIANLQVAPALMSRHMTGQAIDMNISWQNTLTIADASATPTAISTLPRDGTNADLIRVGATYGVIHLINVQADKPHWSSDGH